MNHELEELGQRFARCACGRVLELTQDEFVELTLDEGADLLLDRHKGHVANMTERGQ